MPWNNTNADSFVPDGVDLETALRRTTHLSVVAHQDDIEIMAYDGIAECFGNPDKWFCGVVVTDGSGSPRSSIYANFSDEQMKAVRVREQRKAAVVGEYSAVVQLGYPSSPVKDPTNRSLEDELQRIFAACRPETIYLHNLADKHETHIAVLMHSLAALRRLNPDERPSRVLGCEAWRDLDWMPDDAKQRLTVSVRENLAAALVGVFDSQITGGKRYDLATAGRRLANATYFAPHQTDVQTAVTLAMDLTPLIASPALDPVVYVTQFIDQFRADVAAKVGRFIQSA